MYLLFIAQNQICIGFLCMSHLEKVILWQYYSHLSIFDALHLAYIYIYIYIFWSFERCFKNINAPQDHFFTQCWQNHNCCTTHTEIHTLLNKICHTQALWILICLMSFHLQRKNGKENQVQVNFHEFFINNFSMMRSFGFFKWLRLTWVTIH